MLELKRSRHELNSSRVIPEKSKVALSDSEP